MTMEGNVDWVNNICTSFHIYKVSQKFVSLMSRAKTFDQNCIFMKFLEDAYYSIE